MFLHFKAPTYYRYRSNEAPVVRLVRLASLLLTLPLLLITFQGKTTAQEQEPAGEVLRVRTDLISVPVFVTDARGGRVGGLRQQDFVLRDNGRVVETSYFASGAESVALLFALDASGSARDIISRQREAAQALFSRFGKGSRVAVVRFADAADMAAPFTTNSNQVLEAFDFPATPNRRTAIFDAAMESVRSFNRLDKAERRIVILVSDGLDTASRTKPSGVISEALERSVSFYVIHIPLFEPRDGRLQVRPASKGFRDLAEKTGGKYFMLGDAKSALAPRPQYDLTPIFQAIEDDLRGQYVLGYYPAEETRDNLPHRIEVSLASGNNKKLRVRALRRDYVLKSIE
jgi:Ca-activated chloride channel family protein